MSRPKVILASASPRRKLLLESIGAEVRVMPPAIDDAMAPISERAVSRLVEALAWFKAAQVLGEGAMGEAEQGAQWLVAADTICVVDGRRLGKPASADEAAAMIKAMAGRRHEVITGVALVALPGHSRRIFHDRSEVIIGEISDAHLREHLEQDGWRGRAGGYNFAEVRDRGWPISCQGDPSTVMGLPLRLLEPMLSAAPRRNFDAGRSA
ncbi:MAG: Maf-like protein [Phycisphaeraceae bacterium]|nr:Maf-like protein [Phycisphaeraceae bacterium]